jgi:enterochelin esterase family protein
MVPITAQGFGRPRPAAGGIRSPNGIALSPNQDYLAVSEYGGTNVWHYYLREDGTLMGGERYMTLRTVGEKPDSAGDGMTTDFEGRYYVTSRAGIQMFDRVGRMGGVIAPPNSNACVSVAFAGPKREWLYVCNGQKIWRRRTLTHGI